MAQTDEAYGVSYGESRECVREILDIVEQLRSLQAEIGLCGIPAELNAQPVSAARFPGRPVQHRWCEVSGTGPVERDVLARIGGPLEFVAEGVASRPSICPS